MTPKLFSSIRVAAYVAAAGLAACGDDAQPTDSDGAVEEGASHHGGDTDGATDEGEVTGSGATCPTDDAPTYQSFGEAFMASYCTRCHSSELEGAARNGAPLAHDFDSLEGILAVAEHIDQKAAAGPDAVNEAMPPDGDKPSQAEREMLGQWLACEAQ